MQLKEYFAEIERVAAEAKAKLETAVESSPTIQTAVETVKQEVTTVAADVKAEAAKVAPSVSEAYIALKADAAGLVAALRAWVDDFEKRHAGK